MRNSISIAACAAIVSAGALSVCSAAAEPTVLHFAPGAYTVRATGTMSIKDFTHKYSVDLRKGQLITLSFDGDGPLIGEIDCRGEGGYIGPISGDSDTLLVPQSGPCIITIEISRMAERWNGSYRMALTAK